VKDFEESKKVCAYVGLVQRVRKTGESVRNGHITRMDNKIVRRTLVEVALIAIKCKKIFKKFSFEAEKQKRQRKSKQ
jgi:transposase